MIQQLPLFDETALLEPADESLEALLASWDVADDGTLYPIEADPDL